MHGMYINGCLYSDLCAGRSALSSIVTIKGYTKLSEHSFISRYLKGIYNIHPPLPKYTSIWNISLVLDYCKGIETNDKLQFKDLSKKTVMVFMILGARRKQALFTITVDYIVTEDNEISFFQIKLYNTNTHRPLESLIYQGYPLNENLCIVKAVQCCLGMRENLADANTKEFIITYVKPYKPASSDTISRLIKGEPGMAGINTNVYKPHSCRSASTSKALHWG